MPPNAFRGADDDRPILPRVGVRPFDDILHRDSEKDKGYTIDNLLVMPLSALFRFSYIYFPLIRSGIRRSLGAE